MNEVRFNPGFFHSFIERARAEGSLICQPRMGFSTVEKMRRGLEAVRDCEATSIGTITLDSYTRTGEYESLRKALERGQELNGYPIVTRSFEENRALLDGVLGPEFPIQVRHGTSLPEKVFEATVEAGLDATEGGPVSYCLPYSRTPLAESIQAWERACRWLAELEERGITAHLESFGGCMLGQLCPPSLLVTISILEGLFFHRCGLRSISLSYAQNYNFEQDVGGVLALRELAAEYLPASVDWHVVIYTFMGRFPETSRGARRILEESAEIAIVTGSERLIVKTGAEAHQIPTIADNTQALVTAHQTSRATAVPPRISDRVAWHRDFVRTQSKYLLDMVLDLEPSLPEAIAAAFRQGYIDVPFCLHPDNHNRARSWVDHDGTIHWSDPGRIPFPSSLRDSIFKKRQLMSSAELARALSLNQQRFDELHQASRRKGESP